MILVTFICISLTVKLKQKIVPHCSLYEALDPSDRVIQTVGHRFEQLCTTSNNEDAQQILQHFHRWILRWRVYKICLISPIVGPPLTPAYWVSTLFVQHWIVLSARWCPIWSNRRQLKCENVNDNRWWQMMAHMA